MYTDSVAVSTFHSCCTRCNVFCNSIWLQGHKEALLIAWIPKQIISPENIVGWSAWGVAGGSGACMRTVVWVITQWLWPAAFCWAVCTQWYKRTWGVYSVLHYQNLNSLADKVFPKWSHISIDNPRCKPLSTHHRPKLMRDKKLWIREFGFEWCSFALLYAEH